MAKSKTQTAANPQKSRSGQPGVSLAILVALASALYSMPNGIPSFTGPNHANKPFNSFSEFYPFYLSQHMQPDNRLLHVIGTCFVTLLMLANFKLVPSVLAGGLTGYLLCQPLIGLPHGFIEFAAFLSTFFLVTRISGASLKKAFLLPMVGYLFAWVGHFYFEHNRPATFIYPTSVRLTSCHFS